MNFYYKFSKVQSEYLSVTAMIYDTAAGVSMCSGIDVISTGASTFTLRSVPISCSAGTPIFCDLTFGLDINTGSVPSTSTFEIDDISLTTYPLAITEPTISETTFSIYPNPVHGSMTIHTTGATSQATITIYDVLGASVCTAQDAKDGAQINISTLAPGLYTVILDDAGTRHAQKIMID